MIRLKINNVYVEVPVGTSVMKAAEAAGIAIPALCWHDELEHFTSCMVCLVKDGPGGRLFPSCSVQASDGMSIITEDSEISEARQTALELLLSEHLGDCEAPCQLACPAHMNIPRMNRLIAAGKFGESLEVVKNDIALPSILGRICPAPCEGACHRRTVDEPVSICMLKRFVGDRMEYQESVPTEDTGFRVAVVGAGPAGLAASYHMQRQGVGVTLFDANEKPGGNLRSAISREILPEEVLDGEIETILRLGVRFEGSVLLDKVRFDELRSGFDAVVLATGTLAKPMEEWGLASNPKGLEVTRDTYETTLPVVFAVGNLLRSSKLAVRSVGQGKEVAFSVWQYLNNKRITGEPRLFNSRFGKLKIPEIAEYLKESVSRKRNFPEAGHMAGFTAVEAIREAERCLHCDCRAIDDCKLRTYSDRYKADQKRFMSSERKNITKVTNHDLVIYEPGKCIKCGICVRLTEKYGEPFGFTYIGRGFDVVVSVPFNEELKEGLAKTAEIVAQGCPTGAISLK